MDVLPTALPRLLDVYPGKVDVIRQLSTLLTSRSPTFIYLQDAFTFDTSCSLIRSLLLILAETSTLGTENFAFVTVDCVACFTQKLLFDTVLNTLVEWKSTWENEYRVWNGDPETSKNWNESTDTALRGLGEICKGAATSSTTSTERNSKKVVIVFERIERFRDSLPGVIFPLTRLEELTGGDITTVFVSETEWEHMMPSPGTISDPYRIIIEPPTKQEMIEMINKSFPQEDQMSECISPYNPSLRSLFTHFVETVYDVCAPFTMDPRELRYIVSARWSGFVSPLLEDWKEQGYGPYHGPSEDGRMRLMKLFNASLTSAVETLYPRYMGASEWSTANSPPSGLRLSRSAGRQLPPTQSVLDSLDTVPELSRMSIFILLASFLASYNPAKTDLRMFGRGAEERSRRKRKGGGTRKSKPGSVAKLPQRLLGPMSFGYDRLIAILGSLLQEYDEHSRGSQFTADTSGTDAELDAYRVLTAASIQELVSMCLLHRTSAEEKIDALSFKCGVSFDQALALARKLGVPLSELMWEPY